MEHKQVIKRIAESILSELEYFRLNISPHSDNRRDVLANPESSLTGSTQGLQELGRVNAAILQTNAQLQKEPFIAYVKAEVDGEIRIIYICREYVPRSGPQDKSTTMFASYKASYGQIVEQDVNTSFELQTPDRNRPVKRIKVLEKDLFKPVRQAHSYDAISNQFFLDAGIYSIGSLRQFIDDYFNIETRDRDRTATLSLEEIEASLRKALEQELTVKEGLAREIRSRIALRDQPTLDAVQGNIFRLPVSMQLIITGAPGTGKTTTLIKRIAQKSNPSLMTPSEKEGFSEDELEEFFSIDRWVMYAPTELLKIYLKEAFVIEGIPASDKRIRIWNDERTRISREVLKFSRIGDKGYFGRTTKQILTVSNNTELMKFATQFDDFYCNFIVDRFEKSLSTLEVNNSTPQLVNAFQKVSQQLADVDPSNLRKRIFYLVEKLFENRDTFNELSKELDEEIDNNVRKVTGLRDEIFQVVFETMQNYTKQSDGMSEQNIEEPEEEDQFEELTPIDPETPDYRLIANRQIRKTLVWYSQRLATKQKITEDTLNYRIINLLSENLPGIDYLTQLGKKIIDRKVANVLTRGYSNLLDRIPFYYQRFRLSLLSQEQIYFSTSVEKNIRDKSIDDNEYDLIMYTMLRNARVIIDRNKKWIKGNSGLSLLENIKSEYVTQIAVDEATDFSSLQLGAMFYLAHPQFKSVTFSGDLMQRLTSIGITSWDDLSFISDSFITHNVTTVYRQSRKLLGIASKLYEHFIGMAPSFISAFQESESDPDPLKYSSGNNIEDLSEWIALRIIEIYRINDTLPSIAVFVPEEDQIDNIYNILSSSLMNHSIEVEACSRGKILSTEGKVRIFSVRYIKGLEFESVFFVNLDQLSPEMATLIDKYLYVGLTRAASFLAITYAENFPEKIRFIEDDFLTGDWGRLVT